MTAHAQLKALRDKYSLRCKQLQYDSEKHPPRFSEYDPYGEGTVYGTEMMLVEVIQDIEACLAEQEGA